MKLTNLERFITGFTDGYIQVNFVGEMHDFAHVSTMLRQYSGKWYVRRLPCFGLVFFHVSCRVVYISAVGTAIQDIKHILTAIFYVIGRKGSTPLLRVSLSSLADDRFNIPFV